MDDQTFHCYAVTQPGLEALTAEELARLGVTAGPVEPGGVPFDTDRRGLYSANLALRTATRVLVRVASFHAASFAELERHARKVEWGAVLPKGSAVRFRVTSRKSKLYHQDAVAERLLRAAGEAVEAIHPAGPAAVHEDHDDDPPQVFVVRLFRDTVTVSADSSGALLHRRGYRRAVAKAPLRETVAAAMLLAVHWSGGAPLVDPFCGSGTIPIEAALIAAGMAPGRHRRFAFERWGGFDQAVWTELLSRADARVQPVTIPIIGGDRDAGAIEAARSNAERAGVSEMIEWRQVPLSKLEFPEGEGWVVTNPPYGVRIGERERLRDLYARLGQVMQAHPGWRLAFLSSHPMLAGQTGLRLSTSWSTNTGGIPVRLERGWGFEA